MLFGAYVALKRVPETPLALNLKTYDVVSVAKDSVLLAEKAVWKSKYYLISNAAGKLEGKWWYRRGWETRLLLLILLVASDGHRLQRARLSRANMSVYG
jgi:hypothetical protein